MSTNSTNPNVLFGGSWEQIKDTFLLACGNTYANGSTGGSRTATINYPIGWTSDGRLSINQSRFSGATSSSNTWTRRTTAENYATGMTGSSISEQLKSDTISIMPPYLAVYVWKRTA